MLQGIATLVRIVGWFIILASLIIGFLYVSHFVDINKDHTITVTPTGDVQFLLSKDLGYGIGTNWMPAKIWELVLYPIAAVFTLTLFGTLVLSWLGAQRSRSLLRNQLKDQGRALTDAQNQLHDTQTSLKSYLLDSEQRAHDFTLKILSMVRRGLPTESVSLERSKDEPLTPTEENFAIPTIISIKDSEPESTLPNDVDASGESVITDSSETGKPPT